MAVEKGQIPLRSAPAAPGAWLPTPTWRAGSLWVWLMCWALPPFPHANEEPRPLTFSPLLQWTGACHEPTVPPGGKGQSPSLLDYDRAGRAGCGAEGLWEQQMRVVPSKVLQTPKNWASLPTGPGPRITLLAD